MNIWDVLKIEAVHLADQTEEEFDVAIPDTPEQQMLASLEALYDDYARRINPDEWLALFNSDYFVSLDTSEDALYGLLRFLMNHVLVPKKVWKCIVGYFDLEGRRSELAKHKIWMHYTPRGMLPHLQRSARKRKNCLQSIRMISLCFIFVEMSVS